MRIDEKFFCEVCNSIFLIPDELSKSQVTIACPTCGRQAKVGVLPGGGAFIRHSDHIFVCPRPLNNNPLVMILVYVGVIVVLAAVFSAVAKWVHPLLCPVVFLTILLTIVLIGAIQLSI